MRDALVPILLFLFFWPIAIFLSRRQKIQFEKIGFKVGLTFTCDRDFLFQFVKFRLQGTVSGLPVQIWTQRVRSRSRKGRSSTWQTYIDVLIQEAASREFVFKNKGFMSRGLLKIIGLTENPIGVPSFDEKCLTVCTDSEYLRRLLNPNQQNAVLTALAQHPDAEIQLANGRLRFLFPGRITSKSRCEKILAAYPSFISLAQAVQRVEVF